MCVAVFTYLNVYVKVGEAILLEARAKVTSYGHDDDEVRAGPDAPLLEDSATP